jgi:hypothetical protein
MRTVEGNELKELLIKNWMTHDAMWLYHSVQQIGIEKANVVNKAAVRSMGAIEGKRIAKALGVERIKDFGQFREFFSAAMEIVLGDFMKTSSFSYHEDNRVHAEWERCFAYEGLKRYDMIDRYKCGIFDRLEGWFDGLGILYTASPIVDGCMMYTEGRCYRDYTFEFPH